ncbi:MAG: metallophosphoesterase, partial [Holosporales bacterium]|nr:metallophosphoesterase [Holosporales bacterium]
MNFFKKMMPTCLCRDSQRLWTKKRRITSVCLSKKFVAFWGVGLVLATMQAGYTEEETEEERESEQILQLNPYSTNDFVAYIRTYSGEYSNNIYTRDYPSGDSFVQVPSIVCGETQDDVEMQPVEDYMLIPMDETLGKIEQLFNLCGDLARKQIIISLPDLHGAHYSYEYIVSLVSTIREHCPNNKITVVFPGDAAARVDPPYCPREQQLGYFCEKLLYPLKKEIPDINVIYAIGNHDLQNAWRFLSFLIFLHKNEIPCITHFKDWIRTNWAGVTRKYSAAFPDDALCLSIHGKEDPTEDWENYGVEPSWGDYIARGEEDFNPLIYGYISGNTLFFPYCLAWAGLGGGVGGNGAEEIFNEGVTKGLYRISQDDSRGKEYLDTPEGQDILDNTAKLFREGIEALINNNPNAQTFNVFIASHATITQTENFFIAKPLLCHIIEYFVI